MSPLRFLAVLLLITLGALVGMNGAEIGSVSGAADGGAASPLLRGAGEEVITTIIIMIMDTDGNESWATKAEARNCKLRNTIDAFKQNNDVCVDKESSNRFGKFLSRLPYGGIVGL
ncbi:hypothetical protein GPALN_003375 [Globodera pallida]|nr:hypothetical protein GPALN_003375 [Globodera pallida]